jgi:hypothetical protein
VKSRIEYGYANGRRKAGRIRTTGASEEAGKDNIEYITIITITEI